MPCDTKEINQKELIKYILETNVEELNEQEQQYLVKNIDLPTLRPYRQWPDGLLLAYRKLRNADLLF